MSMDMKVHDLEPALKLTVEDLAGVANLNSVVSWRIIGRIRGTTAVNAAPDTAVVDGGNPAKAVLTRAWLAGETAVIGDMYVEAEATWPGGRLQTFPASTYELVRFHRDLA